MNGRFRTGLVVGKFSPLHRGHELLIDHAVARCDDTIIISYSSPEFDRCSASARADWLQARWPCTRRLVLTADGAAVDGSCRGLQVPPNDAADDVQRLFVARLCLDVLRTDVDAVFTSEHYGDGFAEALTRSFAQLPGRTTRVAHVLVDRTRRLVPVSGSAIRADVHAHRAWLLPAVYAAFVQRVCVLGAESTGKSTLAAALARASGTAWVPEYGRALWTAKAGELTLDDMLAIAERQVADEEITACGSARYLFCDTSPLTTLFYSRRLFGTVDRRLDELANRPYDAYVLCAPDYPFVQDGTRAGEAFRREQHEWYVRELGRRNIHYLLATGSVTARVDAVLRHLKRLS